MVRNEKGDRRERELVNLLDDTGDWAVMRAPASGSATERELPDVLTGNGNTFLAIEAKSSGGNPIYIDEQEIVDLGHFAEKFGAQKLVGARFDYNDWYFFHPENMYRTDSGNYRIKEENIENGIHIDDLLDNPAAALA